MMEQVRLCAVWPTENWLGLNDCLRMLQSCFRKRTSASISNRGKRPTLMIATAAASLAVVFACSQRMYGEGESASGNISFARRVPQFSTSWILFLLLCSSSDEPISMLLFAFSHFGNHRALQISDLFYEWTRLCVVSTCASSRNLAIYSAQIGHKARRLYIDLHPT